jgi:hypothetical protein
VLQYWSYISGQFSAIDAYALGRFAAVKAVKLKVFDRRSGGK